MATSTSEKTTSPSNYLTPHQQNLLFAALNSNKSSDKLPALSTTNLQMDSLDFSGSPVQQTPGSGTLGGFNDSPFIDDYYDFDADGQFDFDSGNDALQGQMIGKMPGTSSSDGDESVRDKRGHPGDEDEDEEGGGKRREGEDKASKKPGRKPLTSEPTSKRKAQNRAAQRAFRERKEKHLKDLEVKVQDLEKASESANHENSILRAQIDKMGVELREYKKRLSVNANRSSTLNSALPPYLAGKGLGNSAVNSPNGVNFQFEFPKFGSLPGPPALSTGVFSAESRNQTSPTAASHQVPGVIDRQSVSPMSQYLQRNSSSESTSKTPQSAGQLSAEDMSSLSGLFSPSILESIGKNPFDNAPQNGTGTTGSRTSTESSGGQNSSGQNTSYSSPSASSNSNHGPSSSCGTSPEPYSQSPNSAKPLDSALTTIGEEHTKDGETTFCEKLNMACGNPKNPIPQTMSKNSGTSDTASAPAAFDFDWFAQQNGNQFDPVLFGDYRDPQENVLSSGDFNDAFFSDAFALPEFNSPFNVSASPAPKVDLIKQIDDKQNEDEEEIVPADSSKMLSCSNIWEQLQTCPQVQEESFDLNDLCSKLQKQAKCSETGAVVDEKDFKAIMREYAKTDGTQPLDDFAKTMNHTIRFDSTITN